jgi:hypothetical protein
VYCVDSEMRASEVLSESHGEQTHVGASLLSDYERHTADLDLETEFQ